MNTNQKGEIAQLKVQLRAAELGVTLSKPTTEVRYDFVMEERGKLLRAQVKWGGCPSSHSSGSVQVDLRKDSPQGAKKRTYSDREVDVLLVYVPQLDKVLRFWADRFHGKPAIVIRLEPPKNGQRLGLTLAESFIW